MNAIAVERGETEPSLLDVPEPTPDEGEALLRTLRVGIDGTDFEVLDGNHGGFPAGDEYQILGHEAVCAVADPNGTDLTEGELVVPTVRRPAEGSREFFDRGEPDMAPPGTYRERGIEGAHGFMAEFVTTPAEFLVPIPDAFAETGVLIEPMSNTVKALELAFASRSLFEWEPERALVLGNGPLGLLTLAMLQPTVERSYCLGRRDRPDPTIDIIEEFGATYVDSRTTPVSDIADIHEPMDLVYEATGHAKHAYDTIDVLAPNGVGVLLGIPTEWTFDIDGGCLHRELVLGNKALLGSVNSNIRHFETAKESLESLPDWVLERIITDVYSPTELEAAFDDSPDRIKRVIDFT
ncbi:glucose 1-dehydrogenase [Natrialba asiatica]|uniref:Glucose 1-dehydrogenase n=1 Tax=Natrialba asiatica (strain ATCC 700177 / DSM 12278 / JCM 9576 / FERM P-10747 / NBRC 102637 / 172P1) TaxID=29540 RepID=M0B3C1_NATA1|nr:glucose 1-dehydrogenase [Natrialba asiatica]ELZ05406.1 Alcohol dehydrogenase GroES domain protein [Natrialba asiatica DSM 12278]